MLEKKLELVNEQSSPLFRIMWVYNQNEPTRRFFENNICAFHIGNKLILSVAHNLKLEAGIFRSIDETSFQNEIITNINPTLRPLFNRTYVLDTNTNKRYQGVLNQVDFQSIINELKRINYDTRWITFNKKNICKPFLVVQFKNNQFYNDQTLTNLIPANAYMHEPSLNRHTFLIPLELVEGLYSQDIAIYRIIDTKQEVTNRIPKIDPDFSTLDDNQESLYCLQSSPSSEVGKLLNKAHIDGFLENFSVFNDSIGGNYTFEGLRYLIKGYFRFGSSGAPYVFFDTVNNSFKINAIQSEACPIQLSINNNMTGNLQYVNAIATPLSQVQDRILIHQNV